MRVYRGLETLRPGAIHRPVLAFGVFDGMHRGHRALLDLALAWAREVEGEPVALTFDRHPRGVLTGEAPRFLGTLEHRLVLMGEMGYDHLVVLPFDEATAAVSAEGFVTRVLVGHLGIHGVVVGHDQRFGAGGRGDAATLGGFASRLGFEVRVGPCVVHDGRPISSSAIRRAVETGDLRVAEAMLGRPVEVYGVVVRGDARGRTLGFPTANLDLHHAVRPPRGVYAAAVVLDGRVHGALVNIGRRPTFEEDPGGGAPEPAELFEAHLLDFDGDLYGRDLRVLLLGHLRDERRFDGPEALVAQIHQDRARFLRDYAGRLGTLAPVRRA